MSWIPFFAIMLVALAVFAVPGFLLARILRLRNPYSFGFAPVLGMAVVGTLTLVCAPLGVLWGWLPWTVVTSLLAIVLAVEEVLIRRRHPGVAQHKPVSIRQYLPLIYMGMGVLTYAMIRIITYLPVIAGPASLPHYGDADFHLQGALIVHQSGDVFPIGALDDLYTPQAHSAVYYPTLWHAWVSLLMSFGGVVVATNAAAFTLALIMWPTSIALLGLALRPKNPGVAFLAPVVASPVATFPGAVAVGISIYPFSLSLMTVPVAIAALAMWMRGKGARCGFVYFLAILAALIAQPSAAIFSLVAGGFAVVALLVRWLHRSIRSGSWIVPLVTVGSLAVFSLGVFYYFWRSPYLQKLGGFERQQAVEHPVRAFFDGTIASVYTPWKPWIAILVLAVIGLLALMRFAYGWMYLSITVVVSVAYIAAAGPDSRWRVLTGPWYKDQFRLAAIATALVSVAAAVGVSWLLDRLIPVEIRTRFGIAGAIIFVIVYPLCWNVLNSSITQSEREIVATGYILTDQNTTALKKDTAELLGRLDQHFGPDERLLALYANGGAFSGVLSDVEPFVPIRTMVSKDQRVLRADFDKITTDPKICEIIEKNNIKAFMADSERAGYLGQGPLGGPPNIDVSNGFELVDQQGSVKLWRITACD